MRVVDPGLFSRIRIFTNPTPFTIFSQLKNLLQGSALFSEEKSYCLKPFISLKILEIINFNKVLYRIHYVSSNDFIKNIEQIGAVVQSWVRNNLLAARQRVRASVKCKKGKTVKNFGFEKEQQGTKKKMCR